MKPIEEIRVMFAEIYAREIGWWDLQKDTFSSSGTKIAAYDFIDKLFSIEVGGELSRDAGRNGIISRPKTVRDCLEDR